MVLQGFNSTLTMLDGRGGGGGQGAGGGSMGYGGGSSRGGSSDFGGGYGDDYDRAPASSGRGGSSSVAAAVVSPAIWMTTFRSENIPGRLLKQAPVLYVAVSCLVGQHGNQCSRLRDDAGQLVVVAYDGQVMHPLFRKQDDGIGNRCFG